MHAIAGNNSYQRIDDVLDNLEELVGRHVWQCGHCLEALLKCRDLKRQGLSLLGDLCKATRFGWASLLHASHVISPFERTGQLSQIGEWALAMEMTIQEAKDIGEQVAADCSNQERARKHLDTILLRKKLLRLLRSEGVGEVYKQLGEERSMALSHELREEDRAERTARQKNTCDQLIAFRNNILRYSTSDLTQPAWLRARTAVLARAYWGLSRDLRSLSLELAREAGPYHKSIQDHSKIAHDALICARLLANEGNHLQNDEASGNGFTTYLLQGAKELATLEEVISLELSTLSNGQSKQLSEEAREESVQAGLTWLSRYVAGVEEEADAIARAFAEPLPQILRPQSHGPLRSCLAEARAFRPSPRLTQAVIDGLAYPCREFLGLKNTEIPRLRRYDLPFQKDAVSEIISMELERCLSDQAYRLRARAGPDDGSTRGRISSGGRFAHNVAKALADGLQLSPIGAKEVLDLLFTELKAAVNKGLCTRNWGHISFEDDELWLEVKIGEAYSPSAPEVGKRIDGPGELHGPRSTSDPTPHTGTPHVGQRKRGIHRKN